MAMNKASSSAGITPRTVPTSAITLPAIHTRDGAHLPFSFITTENNLMLQHRLTRALVQASVKWETDEHFQNAAQT